MNWFSQSIEQTEKKLKTNAASGLTRKAARARYSREAGTLFYSSGKSLPAMLAEIISDFALILLIIMAVIALCFSETATALSVLIIVFLNLAVTLVIYYRSQRLFESLSVFFSPTVRVIREGKLYNIDFRHAVPGDVILIEPGDIICCDARLVTSDNLRVKMRVDRDSWLSLEKAAGGPVREGENDPKNFVNMIHAGSVVENGTARAIVTAVGKYTYLGAMTGGIRIPVSRAVPSGLALLRRYCSRFSFVITLIILPFSILSLLFSGGNVTLFTTFLTALAVAASSMSQFAATLCTIFFAKQMRSCLKASNPAVIRSADIMDRLVEVDYLYLLDGSVLTDGILHFETAYCADGEIRSFSSASGGAYFLAELAELYYSAQNRAVSTGTRAPGRYNEGLNEFIKAMQVDREALQIRCEVNGFTTGTMSDMNDRLYYSDRGEKLILSISETPEMLRCCSYMQKGNTCLPLSDTGRETLIRIYNNYRRAGKHVIVFTFSTAQSRDSNDERRFAGMVVFGENADASTVKAVKKLAKLGVKTVYFTDSVVDNKKNYPAPEIPPQFLSAEQPPLNSSYLAANGLPVSYGFGKVSRYSRFTPSDVKKLIEFAHSKGKKVAVAGFSEGWKEVYDTADVFVTCSPADFVMSGRFEHEIEAVDTAGDASGKSCPQTMKQSADVIIPRPDAKGRGGLSSMVSAFVGAGGAYYNLAGFFRYILCAQFIRIFTVMLPMLFGSAPLDARHILFCSMITDVFVLMIFAYDRAGIENSRSLKALKASFRSPIYSNAGILIASVSSAVATVVLPRIFSILPFGLQYLYETEFSFISLLLTQLTAFYCIRFCDIRKNEKYKINRTALSMIVFELTFVIICFAFERFGAQFDIAQITFPYLVLSFVPSAVFVIIFYFFGSLNLNRADGTAGQEDIKEQKRRS